MYSRVSRGLFVVGRQIRKKLCENTNTVTGTAACAATAAVNSATNNHVLNRTYCNKNSDESPISPPKLLSPDEDAELKLKDLLAVPENQRLQKIIELEIEVMRQNDERVPVTLKPRHWYELLNLDSRSKRKRYLEFIFTLEKKRENQQRAKDEKNKRHLEELANEPEEKSPYRLGANTMFLRFYDSTINHMYNSRLMSRMLFGQQIVLDCGYEGHMTAREIKNCSKQLQLTWAANRIHEDPFDLYLCNANLHGELMKHLNRFIPPLYNPEFPINIKTESYLDVFDKDKLVYLTPHCQQEMNEFDHDAVYIIGAFVDKSSNEPVSMAKAKKEGLKMMKFPLNRYLQWGSSSGKNLTLNQVISVLLDLRLTGSWEEALKHVPTRKLLDARNSQMDRRLKRNINFRETDNVEYETKPVQELKLKEKFIYKPDRSHRPQTDRDSKSTRGYDEMPRKDFTMKSRQKMKSNWKN